MSPELIKAFTILVVGMLSVFTILGLVVLSGKTLIFFVNRFFPVATSSSTNIRRVNSGNPSTSSALKESETPTKHIAAIVAFVDQMTGGKAVIKNIERVSDRPNKTEV